jgi:hypothetical protein
MYNWLACCLQSDPLKETLDGVLPLVEEGAEALGTVPTNVPQSIEEVHLAVLASHQLSVKPVKARHSRQHVLKHAQSSEDACYNFHGVFIESIQRAVA